MTKPLGKLERVDLRDVWPSEPRDFTPWLAKEESLELLGETIGMELELETTEKDVGPFSADILCKDIRNDSWVVIENQLEKTNHDHLGKVLTYGAGLDAFTMVWIASKFTDEHRAALDRLNKITDDKFHFFGLEVEAWKIGESLPAPKFNIISQPNNWSEFVSSETHKISEGEVGETKAMQYRYWQQLEKYMENKNSKLSGQTPGPWQSQCFSIGRSGAAIFAKIYVRENKIRVEIDLNNRKTAKSFFNLLKKEQVAIEEELGLDPDLKLDWDELSTQVHSSIGVYKDVNLKNDKDWENQHAWLKETLEKFDRVFRERIKKLDPKDWNPDAPK